MVNYSKGKIYKIESHLGNKIYIGSTTKERLCQRMDTLRHNYDSWKNNTSELTTAYEIFEEYGVNNCQLVLLESFPCTCKDELESRKSFYIKSMDCVNKVIPQRTKKEYREDNNDKLLEQARTYKKNNRENLLEKKQVSDKLYRDNNKEKISARRKEQRQINIDERREQERKYRELNKEKISARRKELRELKKEASK